MVPFIAFEEATPPVPELEAPAIPVPDTDVVNVGVFEGEAPTAAPVPDVVNVEETEAPTAPPEGDTETTIEA